MTAPIAGSGNNPPDEKVLARTLGGTKALWDELIRHVETEHAPVTHRWTASKTSALGFLRLVQKKRTILYLLPREGYFLTAFVFGEKATAAVRASDVPDHEEARGHQDGPLARALENAGKFLAQDLQAVGFLDEAGQAPGTEALSRTVVAAVTA